jgi:hypothetical protein
MFNSLPFECKSGISSCSHFILSSQLKPEISLMMISKTRAYLSRLLTQASTNEAHQGVMADRRHSLKRGDRLPKKTATNNSF